MRTQKKNIFKTISMVALTLFLVSCGKDNKSGGNNNFHNGFPVGGQALNPDQIRGTVLSWPRTACTEGTQRIVQTLNGPSYGFVGVAVGATSMGDIAILTSHQNGSILEVHICQSRNGYPVQVQTVQPMNWTPTGCGFNNLTAYVSLTRPGYQNGAFNPVLGLCQGNGNFNNQNPYNPGYGW